MKHKFVLFKSWLLVAVFSTLGLQVALAQFVATGRVTNSNGEALIGTSVAVVGANRGTISDLDGNYLIGIPGNSATLDLKSTRRNYSHL